VIDLGLRLADVQKYGLQTEACHLRSDPARNLLRNGATQEEIAFLRSGQRVELNAFTSDQLLEWVESKLQEHEVKKVVPDDATLEVAYRRAALAAMLNDRLAQLMDKARQKVAGMKVDPGKLRAAVEADLDDDPCTPWDRLVAEIAEGDMVSECTGEAGGEGASGDDAGAEPTKAAR
jgi:hypothetical protein